MTQIGLELIVLFSLFVGCLVTLVGMLGYAIINKWRGRE